MKKSVKHKFQYLLFFLLSMPAFIFASAQDIRVNIDFTKASLGSVLNEIGRQTSLSIVYNTGDVNPTQPVSIKASNENITTVMNRLLRGTGLSYSIMNKHLILSTTDKNHSIQQEKVTVTGNISDAKGEPLIGVSILVKGTSNGTITDMNGHFSLPVAKGDVIEISYIGYAPQAITVTDSKPLKIVMKEDAEVLDEVVVTALGIKRAQKALSYNVQQVGGDAINTVKDANFINSLQGKVAGVTINNSAGGVGSASRVVMRGTKSITKDNNALYVIDGIPMFNVSFGKSEGSFATQSGSDGVADLNPDDIESINMLTGPSAAALYGNAAANGVVLINTKKGSAEKTTLTVSNNTMFSDAYMMPEMQNRYGNNPGEFASWGNKTKQSYDPSRFFNTGVNVINAISFSTGTKKNQTYASASAVNSRGIVPNNVYNRYNFSIRNTTMLIKDRLTLDVGATYMKQYTRNQTIQGQYRNPLVGIYLFPRGNDIRKYEIYERPGSDSRYMEQFWDLEFLKGVENPWWITNRELNENRQHRYSFNATMKLDITDWMSLTGRIRTDNATINYTRKLSASTNTLFASKYGSYLNRTMTHNNLYGDVLLSIDKSFFDNAFSLQFNLGASIMDDKNQLTGYEGYLAGIPNKFTYNNIISDNSQSFPTQENYHDQIQAVYATMQLGWRGMLYVDVSVRNDWASMLAFTPKQNIFYPSVGLSAVISSMADLSKAGISFLKVRGSYAEVGNAPERYITGPNYTLTNGVVSTATIAPAKHLEAERTKSFEAGLDVKFLGNKISATATYYNTNTYNQLFLYDAPPSSGYKQKYINAGKVNNWGIEASAGYKNTWRDFSWATTLNFSMNRNKIKELVPEGTRDPDTGSLVDIKEVNKDYGGYRVKLVEGGSIGDFYVKGLLTDDKGHIYVDPNSNTVLLDPDPEAYIFAGNTEARFRWGWNNQFSYKGVSLGVLIDARIGGRGVSATQALMDRFGVSQDSADARENGGVWISDDQQVPDAKTFYANSGDGMAMLSHYVYSMTNVRLRELTLGYDLPSKWFRNKVNMSVSFVGRNLFMFYNKAPFDPEVTASTSTYYQGVDFFMQPSVRTLGFSVKLQF